VYFAINGCFLHFCVTLHLFCFFTLQVTVLCAKNLPEMKRLSRSCDAYVEILLCTQMSATNGYRAHQMHLNTSVLPNNRVHDRHTLLSLAHGGQRLIDVNFWDERVDDPHHCVLTNAFWRSSVQVSLRIRCFMQYKTCSFCVFSG
jgi:hypothetical protein